mgnify:FL=1|tara:strand:+ start:453 stop:746 length:294 start_codon:yes stop_codon:yes gene_type:complete
MNTEKLFTRIDEYHSIAYLCEELYPDSKFWDDKTELVISPLVRHDTFPAHQDGVYTAVFIDDKYTYIVTNVLCGDGHVAPRHMTSVLRLDKVVEEEV